MTDTPVVRRNIHSQESVLISFIRRLEAATSRLEDIASSSVGFEAAPTNGIAAPTTPAATSAPSRDSTATVKPIETLPPSVQAFDGLINTELKTWLDLSSKLGGAIEAQVRRDTFMSEHGQLTRWI